MQKDKDKGKKPKKYNYSLKKHNRLLKQDIVSNVEYKYYPYDPQQKYIIGSDGSITTQLGLVHNTKLDKDGYKHNNLILNAKSADLLTHRIVAHTFFDLPFDAPDVHVHHIQPKLKKTDLDELIEAAKKDTVKAMQLDYYNHFADSVFNLICAPEKKHDEITSLYRVYGAHTFWEYLAISYYVTGQDFNYYPEGRFISQINRDFLIDLIKQMQRRSNATRFNQKS